MCNVSGTQLQGLLSVLTPNSKYDSLATCLAGCKATAQCHSVAYGLAGGCVFFDTNVANVYTPPLLGLLGTANFADVGCVIAAS